MELAKYGEIEDIMVSDNIGDHMIGNVYVKFINEDDANKAFNALNGRFYSGRVIAAEFSPVTDYREAKCRQYCEGSCDRGGYCNFMHPKHLSKEFKQQLSDQMHLEFPDYMKNNKRVEKQESPS